jgi:hypothetical protein
MGMGKGFDKVSIVRRYIDCRYHAEEDGKEYCRRKGTEPIDR